MATPDSSSVITAHSFRSVRLYDPMILRDVCSRRSKPQLFHGELWSTAARWNNKQAQSSNPKQQHNVREPMMEMLWNLRFGDKTKTLQVAWSICTHYTPEIWRSSVRPSPGFDPYRIPPQMFLAWGRGWGGVTSQNQKCSYIWFWPARHILSFKFTASRE